jgi:hypothetical protein
MTLSIISLRRTENFWMDFTNVCCAPVVLLVALVTGGTPIDIWAPPCSCKPIDGSLTLEISIPMKDLRRFLRISSSRIARTLVCVPLLVLKVMLIDEGLDP